MPTFVADAPVCYYRIPEQERQSRCVRDSDQCVVDQKSFLIRACIEIPVHGATEPFVWGVWVSLSEASFKTWRDSLHTDKRSHLGPFFGWLDARLAPYPDTLNLKTCVRLRDNGLRPCIELEPTSHPLATEQRDGISRERVAEIYAQIMHGADT